MRDLDDALHDVFTDLATRAPVPVALADGVRRRAHQRRQGAAAVACAVAVTAAAGTGAAVSQGIGRQSSSGDTAGPGRTNPPSPIAEPTMLPGREGSLLRTRPSLLTPSVPEPSPVAVDDAPIARAFMVVNTSRTKFPVITDYLLGADGEGYRAAPAGCTTGLQMSDNGEWVACSRRGFVDVYRLSTGEKRIVKMKNAQAECIAALTDDGTAFWTQCGAHKERSIIDVATGAVTAVHAELDAQWAPDGSFLMAKSTPDLMASALQHLVRIDARTGESHPVAVTGGEDLYNEWMVFSADGMSLVGFATAKSAPSELLLVRVPVDGGEVTRQPMSIPASSGVMPNRRLPVGLMAETPKHRLVYKSNPSQDLFCFDPATGETTVLVRLPDMTLADDASAPDEQTFFYGGRYATDLLMQLADS